MAKTKPKTVEQRVREAADLLADFDGVVVAVVAPDKSDSGVVAVIEAIGTEPNRYWLACKIAEAMDVVDVSDDAE